MWRKLVERCRLARKFGDPSANNSILELLSCLCRALGSVRKSERSIARRLKAILSGFQERLETFVIKSRGCVATVLYPEIAGHAGVAAHRRMEKAIMACEKTDLRSPAGGGSGSGGFRSGGGAPAFGGGGQRGRQRGARGGASGGRDFSHIKCHNCFQMGHFRDQCPQGPKDKK